MGRWLLSNHYALISPRGDDRPINTSRPYRETIPGFVPCGHPPSSQGFNPTLNPSSTTVLWDTTSGSIGQLESVGLPANSRLPFLFSFSSFSLSLSLSLSLFFFFFFFFFSLPQFNLARIHPHFRAIRDYS
ncbi:hypothetical protein P175DRAFT_0199310 [Aspergillus ochraceoroseus IBT 24754]|uniref:Uncharacterized protein n=1 Tax=Aspergillus ochraceoroseus IBT 24754 TaxID=1392256 RepID=A0A2T5LZR2_9EURO|nr:uncharacterized protein P175DRAFT_0199310 [Aspergillus ochraceoroseus IBT 24754]PTU21770.1 hypothetical protein P175DRAFT_0199310 [Aspergillus ochraceoroseus IBT 24754]